MLYGNNDVFDGPVQVNTRARFNPAARYYQDCRVYADNTTTAYDRFFG